MVLPIATPMRLTPKSKAKMVSMASALTVGTSGYAWPASEVSISGSMPSSRMAAV